LLGKCFKCTTGVRRKPVMLLREMEASEGKILFSKDKRLF